jgi:hypothetical protein
LIKDSTIKTFKVEKNRIESITFKEESKINDELEKLKNNQLGNYDKNKIHTTAQLFPESEWANQTTIHRKELEA